MNNFQRVARNTSYLFISEALIKALGVLWVIYLARSLSVQAYGIYSVVVSFIALFSFLPDMGVGIITIREIAKRKKKTSVLLGESLLLNTTFSFLTIILAFLVSIFFNIGTLMLVFVALLNLFFSSLRSIAIFYFDGTEKMQFSAILNTLNSVLLISFAFIGLYIFPLNLLAVFIGMFLGTLVSMGVSYAVLFKHTRIHLTFNFSKSLFLLKQGFPLGMASFASLIYSRIDVVLLAKLLGNTQAGIYSAATPFSIALVQLINVPFVVALFPALSRLHTESSERFKNAIIKALGVVTLWSIPAAILTSFFAGIFIPVIFGNKYDQAIPILQVLIFSVPFISLSAVLYKVLIVIHKQKDYLYISLLGACVNVLLNIMLIPIYGVIGAALSAVFTQLFLFIIYSLDVFRYLKQK